MNTEPRQDDLNAVLLNTIQQFVVDELIAKEDQRIDLIHRLTDTGSMIIDITNRQKQKKVIVIYADGQITTTPKARRRINEGTRYIPSYVEINANVRNYAYGNAEYKKSIELGFSHSVLKTLTLHLQRELLNDTGYPIRNDERIYAKAGKINKVENTYLINHNEDLTPADTEYYRIATIDNDDCFVKEDKPSIKIVDSVNYSAFLAGREYVSHLLSVDDSPKVGEVNVGDYVVVYHATNSDARTDANRKVVRIIPPPTFTRWFKT